MQQLKTIFRLNSQASNAALMEIAKKIEEQKAVQYVSLVSKTPIAPPSTDIPPTTSNLQSLQTYLNANPGLNVHAL